MALLLRQLVTTTRRVQISCCHFQKTGTAAISETGIRMSTTSTTGSHLERTSDKPRDPSVHKVIVTQIAGISPSVKRVVLSSAVTPVPFSFKAGQWVDLFVPGISNVGGFTITSAPQELKTTGSFHLAIQESPQEQEPAHWVHTACRVKDEVSIRIGGEFFFDPDRELGTTSGLLLIGGGVGINPLSSIIREIHCGRSRHSTIFPTVLLFSAKTQQDLIFKEEFEVIMKQEPKFVSNFFLTGLITTGEGAGDGIRQGRIGLAEIQEGLRTLSMMGVREVDKVKVYICGPPPMSESLEGMTRELNLKNVAVEKWW